MKNILVTGVSRGMGRAVAKVLAQEGYFVFGVYNKSEKEAKELQEEIKSVELFKCDFSNRKDTLSLISKLKDRKLYGIVNSAGVFVDVASNDLEMKGWEETFEVNVHAPLLLMRGLSNSIERGGSIVNISSTDANVASPLGFAYSASKAALTSLTKSFASILSPKRVRVNVIEPGWIGTGMEAPQELLDEVAKHNFLGKTGTYEDIANVVSFLISEKSGYMNGSVVTVDGGDSVSSSILEFENKM